MEILHNLLNFLIQPLTYLFMVYSLELLYHRQINAISPRKKDHRNEDASREEIFEDSESPVFSVNLEKAAFTAKRCNLPSSHEWKRSLSVCYREATWLRTCETVEPILSRSLFINFSHGSRRRAFARTTGGFRHVRGILFALSHRLQLTSCPAILSDPGAPRLG